MTEDKKYKVYWKKDGSDEKHYLNKEFLTKDSAQKYAYVCDKNSKDRRYFVETNEFVIICEDIKIPGTDIVLEVGDMISVVSKQNEAYGDDYQKILHGIIELVERYGLHRKYKDRDLDRIIMDAAEEASIRAMDL